MIYWCWTRACAACQFGMVEEALLKKAVCGRPQGMEVVPHGRQPAQWMLEAADYSTEMAAAATRMNRVLPPEKAWSFEK